MGQIDPLDKLMNPIGLGIGSGMIRMELKRSRWRALKRIPLYIVKVMASLGFALSPRLMAS
jgi:hypothetical protein